MQARIQTRQASWQGTATRLPISAVELASVTRQTNGVLHVTHGGMAPHIRAAAAGRPALAASELRTAAENTTAAAVVASLEEAARSLEAAGSANRPRDAAAAELAASEAVAEAWAVTMQLQAGPA